MLSRHRGTIVLILVLFVEVLVFAYQVRKNREVPLLRQFSIVVVSPVQKAVRGASTSAWQVWREYLDLRGARRDNQRLLRQLDDERLDNQRLQAEVDQAKRLQVLMDFKEQTPSQTLAAAVIGSSTTDTARVILVDKGSAEGIRPDMAVVVPEGVVGKVLRVFPHASQVLLVNDADSGVAVLLENSRVHGIVRGQNKTTCKLGYVVSDDKVEIGERVFTSGEDQIYPKGLPVGVVVEAHPASPFQDITVQPLAKLNRLEEVLIVTNKTDTQLPTEPPMIGPPLPQPPPGFGAPQPKAQAATPEESKPGQTALAMPPKRPPLPAVVTNAKPEATQPPSAKLLPSAKPSGPRAAADAGLHPASEQPRTQAQ